MKGIQGIILDEHNLWRSLIANGDIDNQPSGANIEKLLWEYQIQQIAHNFTHKCNANLRPTLDIDTLNNINFSFEADFEKFGFGYNTAFIKYNKDFNFTKDIQQLFNITKDIIYKWFQENEEYDFGDPVSDETANYFNAAGGLTRYIGCDVTPCNIFRCDADTHENCCPISVCIRYMYLNCFYFPSIPHSPAITDDNGLYIEGISCGECNIDRDNICDNGLCAGCPSHEWYRCQNDNSCNQIPGDPCLDPEFAKNCPMSCDDTCHNLHGSNDSICFNQPQSPTPFPTINPTFNPTKTPTFSPITAIPSVNPTITPSTNPTVTPSLNPTSNPSIFPSRSPTINPSQSRSKQPSLLPTISPTNDPTDFPTITPSTNPITPSINPSINPTITPSLNPTSIFPSRPPTINPSISPTNDPTDFPTVNPINLPTISPTANPINSPITHSPTISGETLLPTTTPSIFPSISPTINPSQSPRKQPSISPTLLPTLLPTADPTDVVTLKPTNFPTILPTISPTVNPTNSPITHTPSVIPTISPSHFSATQPAYLPTHLPTHFPTETRTNSPTETPTTISTSEIPTNPPLIATDFPSETPTISPTNNPTQQPPIKTSLPTDSPNTIHSKPPSKSPIIKDYPSLLPTPAPLLSIKTKNPTKFSSESDDKPWPDYDYKCGINFLPFSEYTKCTYECNGGKKKRTRLVYYYGCYSNTITYLGKQVVSKECNTHKCNVE